MVVYITLDNDNGMMFNNRRQSQDQVMRENMLKHCNGARLWVSQYSRMLFEQQGTSEIPENIIADDNFISKAAPEDYCFVENDSLSTWIDKIDTLVIYKWNRDYPADLYFDFSILDSHWKKFSVNDFKGSSHNKITREVWKRS